jgi:hypothetical protein
MGLTGNHHSPILGAHGFSLLTGAHFFCGDIDFLSKKKSGMRQKKTADRKEGRVFGKVPSGVPDSRLFTWNNLLARYTSLCYK